MVIISHGFKYGIFEVHIFANWASLFTPSTQRTRMLQDGLMKFCDDQSMFFHTFFEISHAIYFYQ